MVKKKANNNLISFQEMKEKKDIEDLAVNIFMDNMEIERGPIKEINALLDYADQAFGDNEERRTMYFDILFSIDDLLVKSPSNFYLYFLRAKTNYTLNAHTLNEDIIHDIDKAYSLYYNSQDEDYEIDDFLNESEIRIFFLLGQLIKREKDLSKHNKKLQNFLRLHAHTLNNNVFPHRLRQVMEEIKKFPPLLKEALSIRKSYEQEIFIKLEGELLRLRYSDNPDALRTKLIKESASASITSNYCTIKSVLDEAAMRSIYRLLTGHHPQTNRILRNIMEHRGVSEKFLEDEFNSSVFFEMKKSWETWLGDQGLHVNVDIGEYIARNIKVKIDGFIYALLCSYFTEVIFNAFKYADVEKEKPCFLRIAINNKVIADQKFIVFCFENYVTKEWKDSGEGLKAIKQDLHMINKACSLDECLSITKEAGIFGLTFYCDEIIFLPLISS